jgi:hypothetical protein
MDRDKEVKSVLPPTQKNAMIIVNRTDLELEHRLLIARLHLLRKQLGYPPLTQKEQTRQAK